MRKDHFVRSLAEPTHVRFGYYYLWLMFAMFYQPSTWVEYIGVPMAIVVLTMVLSLLMCRVFSWFSIRGSGSGRPQHIMGEHLLDELEDTLDFSDGEVHLLKGRMTRNGTLEYSGMLLACVVGLVFLWLRDLPGSIMIVIAAFGLDLCWSIALYCTRVLDVFCCVHADRAGLRISRGVLSREGHLGYDAFTVQHFFIRYGLVRVVVSAGDRRYEFIADLGSYTVLRRFMKLGVNADLAEGEAV